MRKSKEVKQIKLEAGLEYKRGNRTEAYKMWQKAIDRKDEIVKSIKAKQSAARIAKEKRAGVLVRKEMPSEAAFERVAVRNRIVSD